MKKPKALKGAGGQTGRALPYREGAGVLWLFDESENVAQTASECAINANRLVLGGALQLPVEDVLEQEAAFVARELTRNLAFTSSRVSHSSPRSSWNDGREQSAAEPPVAGHRRGGSPPSLRGSAGSKSAG
jgi:hypothetical protein